jgi:broad specificity phosphatase PhoE
MTRIYLIRHGHAAASWSEDADPGLDNLGHSQAEQAAGKLRDHTPLDIVSSPLKRAIETANPLCRELNIDARLEPRIAEIPSPGLDVENRGPWLGKIMQGGWTDVSQELAQWRLQLIDSLCELKADTAVFSHFVAINVAVGSATGDDRVVSFRPDNGSISILESDGQSLSLIERGTEASTHIG